MPTNTVDFTFGNYRRTSLFFKIPPGGKVPEGWKWLCPCGTSSELKADVEQYCSKCGTRLRVQEQKNSEDGKGPMPSQQQTFTVVRVSHFTVRDQEPKQEGE